MRITYRVQHTAGRDEPLHRLLDYLPRRVEVVTDFHGHDPSPLRNYLRCLAYPQARTTHLVVLQDDVLPCTDFDQRLQVAVEEKPDQLISLFVGNLRGAGQKEYRKAQSKGEAWCALHRSTRIIHVVGLVWPIEAAAAFLDWYEREGDRMPVRKPHRSDDQAVGYWLKNSPPHRTLWATVPSLVEHPDDFPQVARTKQRATDAGRRAISFAG